MSDVGSYMPLSLVMKPSWDQKELSNVKFRESPVYGLTIEVVGPF